MIGRRALTAVRRWRRGRKRWPLTRQISMIFALAMLGNALIISVALDAWGNYAIARQAETLSPRARKAWDELQAGRMTTDQDALNALSREPKPIQTQLDRESTVILYGMILLAAVVTFGFGYLIVGRLGRGLSSVADAARRIAEGDLTARASPIKFASREETELTTDFNRMSASLQRAERELAESTASIAHELRTPLTILRGRLHGIADGVFALAPAEIDGLIFQVEGLGRLVDDLQTLSLANSHRLILDIDHTDLATEVRRVLAATRPDVEAAGLEPVLDVVPTPLQADGARIRQVVGAVLANARRYAARSGVLQISTRVDGTTAVLEIVDHGPGLPVGTGDRAFDRFWRGETSRSRNTGGSGLGLAVVRAIVEAHGGSATIDNHAGGGTIFTMRLPQIPHGRH